jgi:hypothetical protein
VSVDGVQNAFTPGKSDALFPTGTTTNTPAGTTTTMRPATSHVDAFDQEIANARTAIVSGQDPMMGTGDGDTTGITIGSGPNAIVVPPDAGKLPVQQPKLTQPVTN